MRLTKLRIQNFRNHADSSLEFGDKSFVVVRGANAAGKSSIRQAISMLLTPSTDALDAQGRGFVSKIRSGDSKAVLTGHIQGQHLLERTVVLNTNTSGRTDRCVCIDDPDFHPLPFENFLEYNRPALMVVLNTDFFMNLPEKEQKNLLAKLVLPARYDFPADKIKAVERAIGPGMIDFAGEPFAVIAAAYKRLYEERSIVNRQVKEFVVPESLPDNGQDSASIQQQINAVRQEVQDLSVKRDQAVKKANESENKRIRLQERLKGTKEKAEEESRRLATIAKQVLSDAKVADLQQTIKGKNEYELLKAERATLASTIAARKAEMVRYEEMPDAGSECPVCRQVIDGEKIAGMAVRAAQERDAAINRDREVLYRMRELGDVDAAILSFANHASALESKVATESILSEKNRLIRTTQQELADMPTAVDATLDFVAPLKDANARIDQFVADLRPIIAAEERKKEIVRKTEELNKLKAKAASVDGLVKYFDKDGIKATLLVEHIGGFEIKINEVLAAFGYKCSLSIEPYEFQVTDTKGVVTPVRELSGSEQLMFSVALQCAVSRAARIGIVVADRMDTFLPPQRSKANRALYDLVQGKVLEQVFLIVSDESREAPAIPGARFFFVENGSVSVLAGK